jgi:hypothetical protein
MDETQLGRAEELLKRLDKASKFQSKYQVYPYRAAQGILDELDELAGLVPNIEHPENKNELIQAELKRRLRGESAALHQHLRGERYAFDTITAMYGIPKEDLENLLPWLQNHREETLASIERLFATKDVRNYELSLASDIPSVRQQAEAFVAVHIRKYHNQLGRLLQDLTQVGEFLRDITAEPTTAARSYFHKLTNTLAIGIPAICYMSEDGTLHIRERDLITLYGHEGMGHALNHVVTNSNSLPYFLTQSSSLTIASEESVTQFYQRRIFEDIQESPETQRALGIEHKFGDVYQEAEDIARLETFQLRLFQYAITVLANKDLGDPQDPTTVDEKIRLLTDVTLYPSFPTGFVERHRHSFDSQGNLDFSLVSELRYCAQPVQRSLREFGMQGITYEDEGRSLIDETFLTGFWTPQGFVDNARIQAARK